ncbi:Ig-like domain repeat protein [Patulibacter sp. NPDC049589]|uniref:Ig-like domain repeat protein n=1 Tax=Patulibacter sp. NPDC049589 TaxID=3154731 RepID=UPI003422273C
MRTRSPGTLFRLLAVLFAATAAAMAFSGSASAAAPDNGWTCRAQSLRLELVGLSPLEPVTNLISAGADDQPCATQASSPLGGPLQSVLDILKPLGVNLGALATDTSIDATKRTRDQEPKAHAKVAGLDVSLLGIASIVKVGAVESTATAKCVAGRPQYSSTFDVGDVFVFGNRVALDLTTPVTEIAGILGPLGPVVRLLPGAVSTDQYGHTRSALEVQVIAAAGIKVLDISLGVSRVLATGTACDPAVAPTVDAPIVDGRTITAAATAPSGQTITACSFAVTPAGGTAKTLSGVYDADAKSCKATLARGDYPAGDYTATASATTSDTGTATSPPAPFTLVAPAVGTPAALSGRDLSVPVTPGSGATVASCEITVGPAGGTTTSVPATYDATTGRCKATLPNGAFPAGEYEVVTKVTDSAGDDATGKNTITTGGPAVGEPALDGRKVTATVAPAGTTTIESCRFAVTPKAGGDTKTVAGTFAVGACTATLPRADFPAGEYVIVASAVDSGGDAAERAGAGVIAGPTVGDPTLTGRDLSVPVTPGSGETVTACKVTVTPVGGGTVTALDATYDATTKACVADLPTDLTPGAYTVDTEVTDSGGETGTGTGQVTLHGPTVGVPSIDGRTVSASVAPENGATVATCEFRLTITGGAAKTVAGVIAGGRCSAALPSGDFPAGEYAIVVEAKDAAGNATTNSGTGRIAADPVLGEATVGTPTIDVRDVSAPVTVPTGVTATGCEISLTPKSGGAAQTVTGTLAGGRCTATLPPATFPPGTYDVVVTVTDDGGRKATGSGTVTVAGPEVGTPVGVGPVVVVPVKPGAGATVTSCTLTVAPAGGGAALPVSGTFDPLTSTCVATLPAGTYPSGQYDVTATITDSNGSKATGSGRVTIAQPAAAPTRVEAAAEVAQSLLACDGGKLAMIEARLVGGRVALSGVALKSLAGRTIGLRLSAKGISTRTVATTKVKADGTFATTAKAPAARLRKTTSRAKYYAVIDSTRSGSLRLTRRTIVTSVSLTPGRIKISGRVSSPLPKKGQAVVIGRRVSCTSYRTVARAKTDSRGRFSVSFAAPKDKAAGLYRAQTRAPSVRGGRPVNRTYTLPRIVVPR